MPNLNIRAFQPQQTQVAPSAGAAIGRGLQEFSSVLGQIGEQRTRQRLQDIQNQQQLDAIRARQNDQANTAAGIAAGTALHQEILENEKLLNQQALESGDTSNMIGDQVKFLNSRLSEINQGQSQEFVKASNGAIRISGIQSQSRLATDGERIDREIVLSSLDNTIAGFVFSGNPADDMERLDDAMTEFKGNGVIRPGKIDDIAEAGLKIGYQNLIASQTNPSDAMDILRVATDAGIFGGKEAKGIRENLEREARNFDTTLDSRAALSRIGETQGFMEIIQNGGTRTDFMAHLARTTREGTPERARGEKILNRYYNEPTTESTELQDQKYEFALKGFIGRKRSIDTAGVKGEDNDSLIQRYRVLIDEFETSYDNALESGVSQKQLEKMKLHLNVLRNELLLATKVKEGTSNFLVFNRVSAQENADRTPSRYILDSIDSIDEGTEGDPVNQLSVDERDQVRTFMLENSFLLPEQGGEIQDSKKEAQDVARKLKSDGLLTLPRFGGIQENVDAFLDGTAIQPARMSQVESLAHQIEGRRAGGATDTQIREAAVATPGLNQSLFDEAMELVGPQ